jgi:hypothetical protein
VSAKLTLITPPIPTLPPRGGGPPPPPPPLLRPGTSNRVTVQGTAETAGGNDDLHVVDFAADGIPRWESRRAWPLPGRLNSHCLAHYQSSNVWVCGATDGGTATGLDQIVLGWEL